VTYLPLFVAIAAQLPRFLVFYSTATCRAYFAQNTLEYDAMMYFEFRRD